MIPDPNTEGRLLLDLDDYINPKTGKKIFGCANAFDHAAKQYQSKFPWAQNIVDVGLLIVIQGTLDLSTVFEELKPDIGSSETQTRNPQAIGNQLDFCMMATSMAWIYADRIAKTPRRRHAVEGRRHFAFSDIRRSSAQAALENNFNRLFPVPSKSVVNSLVAVMLRMAVFLF